MRKTMRNAAVALFATGLISAVGASSAQAVSSVHGCPSGDVCIYAQNVTWANATDPTNTYNAYGPYNLYNQFGNHVIFNNQTGGATMRTCTGSDGKGCQGYLKANTYMVKDLTPINSITLEP